MLLSISKKRLIFKKSSLTENLSYPVIDYTWEGSGLISPHYLLIISSLPPHYLLIISSLSPHIFMRRYKTMSSEGIDRVATNTLHQYGNFMNTYPHRLAYFKTQRPCGIKVERKFVNFLVVYLFLPISKHNSVMKKTTNQALVIFGASGDLTYRKLIPAVFDLYMNDSLPEGYAVLGVSTICVYGSSVPQKDAGRNQPIFPTTRMLRLRRWTTFSPNCFI